jgi:hypothetical protein
MKRALALVAVLVLALPAAASARWTMTQTYAQLAAEDMIETAYGAEDIPRVTCWPQYHRRHWNRRLPHHRWSCPWTSRAVPIGGDVDDVAPARGHLLIVGSVDHAYEWHTVRDVTRD